ncbi:MAG: ubiquitin-like domain-containing protein, partial [Anaerolineae bacterium]|nr:ubiquitin-like domain-containing protein [Anaerolineae bacterium]
LIVALAIVLLMIATLLCASVVISIVFAPPPAIDVTIRADGGTYSVMTHAQDVAALLDELGIALMEGDTVRPGLQTMITEPMTVRIERSRSVTLTVDGESRLYRTHLTNPIEILTSAGITISPSDYVFVDGTRADADSLAQWPVPPTHISVQRALPIQIVDGDNRREFETTSATVGEALFEAGVTLYLADIVTPDSGTAISPNMEIHITRSRPVSIIADGTTLQTRVTGGTVIDALDEAGVTLIGLDYTVPGADITLRPGMYIRVIRVREEVVVNEDTQPYETQYQADPTLEIDQTALVQNGQPGITQTLIRVRYENEVEISREVESTAVTQEPVNAVIAYGTNIVLRTIDTPEGPRQYWRRIRMYATSYHPAALGGDNITATGDVLQKGIVGSDPSLIPYNSQVYVPGYGVGKMADTGALRRRLRIDLGYSDADWVSWSRWVDVYLLAPVPDQIVYLLPDE